MPGLWWRSVQRESEPSGEVCSFAVANLGNLLMCFEAVKEFQNLFVRD